MEQEKLDVEKQKKAKRYARINRKLMVVDLALGGIYVFAWLIFGWSKNLRVYLESFTTNPWLVVALFALIFGGIYFIINLPLSYLSGFVLPHRFGLATETKRGWVSDQVKGILLGGVIGSIVLEVIYFILRTYPDSWWLLASVFILFFSIILGILAPVVLMPLFYKFSLLGDDHADLASRLTALAERAGTRVRGVYKFDMSRRTKAANAALTGLGSTRRIILADTLINEFTIDEVETVLAHELGHHVNNDIPLGIAFESISTVLSLFLASLALKWGVSFFDFQGPSDIAAFPLFLLIMGLYGLVTMPVGNAFSRWRERRADIYALQATNKGEAYASALARLANQNLADADPEPWVEWLLYSHPALSKRIRMARQAN